ncbi:MAG TPA: low specificity L-threonine aldolase [Deltaproteobacteria bacterium]|nr:low specificity L-threonine aldolase [Deltaproteobacteria bacterium]
MKERELRRQFASDNYAGICPEAMEAIIAANEGHALPYGEDAYTEKVCNMFREIFETDCEVFFVFNGTAANSLALASLCNSYHSVLCNHSSHIETDECGAPEFFSNGTKILTTEGAFGKISPEGIRTLAGKRTDIHYPKPRVVSITQATELGTVYTTEELRAIGSAAGELDLRLHMDGARFANALVSLDATPKDITWKVGVDVLCLGGVKNGIAVGEAVIFFNKALAHEFDYRCKQAGQLCSKMRFLSAPWIGLLSNDTWLKNARHANRCAQILEERLREIPSLRIMFPRQVNSVFVEMPMDVITALRDRGWHFYTFIGDGGARLMCSWDTTDDDIEVFVADVRDAVKSRRPGQGTL